MRNIKIKEKIRREMLEKLKNQSEEKRSQKSRIIKEKLFSLNKFKKSLTIMCYISLDTEVDTREIIKDALKSGKKIFTPVIYGDELGISEIKDLDKNLEKGPLGVLQPKRKNCEFNSSKDKALAEKLDLAIIPGLAYDKKGNRLGRGKAYFDRFIENLPGAVKKIGLAFDFQILESIPMSSHDIPVDILINN